MSEWFRLCSVADLPAEGEVMELSLAGRQFCAAMVEGQLRVLDNTCPHRGGPLGQGIVEQGRVLCPWHAWAFDVATGCALHNPKQCVRIHETRIEGDAVLIALP